MGRHALPYSYYKRGDTGYYYYKLKGWPRYKPAVTKREDEAPELIQLYLLPYVSMYSPGGASAIGRLCEHLLEHL